jgi:hypothetical protein
MTKKYDVLNKGTGCTQSYTTRYERLAIVSVNVGSLVLPDVCLIGRWRSEAAIFIRVSVCIHLHTYIRC